jgi:hypothetical protein
MLPGCAGYVRWLAILILCACYVGWLAGWMMLQIIWYLGYDGYAGWLCWNRGRQDIMDGWLFSIFWIISVCEYYAE